MRRTSSYLHTTAVSISAFFDEDPATILDNLSARISQIGGWMLRKESGTGATAEATFEIGADRSLRAYAALIESGLHLSQHSHKQMATVCTCALQGLRTICTVTLHIVCVATAESAESEMLTREDGLPIAA
jgi:hypothetical protein